MSDALERVVLRNDFYKDGFRRMVTVLLISLVVNVILLGSLFFLGSRHPDPVYFATTQDGQLIQLNGAQQPLLNDQAILAWVNRNIPQLYQFDYVNYRSSLQRSRQYFTSSGWQQFMQEFAPVVSQVTNGGLVVSAALYDTPVIVKSGVFGGIPSWGVQVPLLVSYQKDGKVQTQHIIMQVLLQKADPNDSTQLLNITQVIEKKMDDSQ